MKVPNKLTKDGKSYELLSGPWLEHEVFQMQSVIRDLGDIAHTIETVDGENYVYRDSKGYISLAENPGLRKSYHVRNAMLRDQETVKTTLCHE